MTEPRHPHKGTVALQTRQLGPRSFQGPHSLCRCSFCHPWVLQPPGGPAAVSVSLLSSSLSPCLCLLSLSLFPLPSTSASVLFSPAPLPLLARIPLQPQKGMVPTGPGGWGDARVTLPASLGSPGTWSGGGGTPPADIWGHRGQLCDLKGGLSTRADPDMTDPVTQDPSVGPKVCWRHL